MPVFTTFFVSLRKLKYAVMSIWNAVNPVKSVPLVARNFVQLKKRVI